MNTYRKCPIVLMEKKGGIVTKTEYLDIRLIVAGSDNRSVLHETCAKCKGDIGREKICKQKGCKLATTEDPRGAEIVKAIYLGTGEKFVLDPKALEGYKEWQSQLEIRCIVPISSITRSRSLKANYLLPGKKTVGKKQMPDKRKSLKYNLLYDGLLNGKKALVVKSRLNGSEALSAIVPEEGRLVLVKLIFEENFKELDEEMDLKLKSGKAITKVGKEFIARLEKDTKPLKSSLQKERIDLNEKLEQFIKQGKGEIVSREVDDEKITVKKGKKLVEEVDESLNAESEKDLLSLIA